MGAEEEEEMEFGTDEDKVNPKKSIPKLFCAEKWCMNFDFLQYFWLFQNFDFLNFVLEFAWRQQAFKHFGICVSITWLPCEDWTKTDFLHKSRQNFLTF